MDTPQPHIIRLRKPWMKRVGSEQTEVRIEVPEPSPQACNLGASYRRNFNRPSGLEPQSTVLVCIDSFEGTLESIQINDTALPCPPSVGNTMIEFDITSRLRNHNEIKIQLSPSRDDAPVRLGAVSLAIHDGIPSNNN